MPYARRELWLLIGLAAVFAVGIGVREWRAGFPSAVERIEQLDREEPPEPLPPTAPREPRLRRAPRRADAASEAPTSTPSAARRSPSAAVPALEPDPRPLDLNAASVEQISRLPGVGASLARRIVEAREQRGRFESHEALRGVVGLGPKKLAALRELVTTDARAGADDRADSSDGAEDDDPAPVEGRARE